MRGNYQDLVEKVLDELLLERSRCQETVQIGTQELGDKVTIECVSKNSQAWDILGRTYPQEAR